MRCAYIAVLLVLLTAGCGREKAGTPATEPSHVAAKPGTALPAAEPAAPTKPQSEPAAAPEPSATTSAPLDTPAAETQRVETQPATAQPVAKPGAPATPRPRPAAEPAAEPVALAAPQPVAAAAAASSAETPAPPAASPLAPIAPTIAEPPAAVPELDLKALEDQLRQTKGIGFMTKITLKNQVDDLLDRFREHYRGKAIPTMKDLRRSYDLLMMKVLSLLQDADQQLASAIVASREAIWGLLADPVKFETLQG